EADPVDREDPVRVLNLRVVGPDPRPVPGATQVALGEVPARVAGDDAVNGLVAEELLCCGLRLGFEHLARLDLRRGDEGRAGERQDPGQPLVPNRHGESPWRRESLDRARAAGRLPGKASISRW